MHGHRRLFLMQRAKPRSHLSKDSPQISVSAWINSEPIYIQSRATNKCWKRNAQYRDITSPPFYTKTKSLRYNGSRLARRGIPLCSPATAFSASACYSVSACFIPACSASACSSPISSNSSILQGYVSLPTFQLHTNLIHLPVIRITFHIFSLFLQE